MINQISKTAHAIHLAYCKENNIPTQPVWEEVSVEHKEIVYDTVTNILKDSIKTVEESHDNFIKKKYSQGWIFGEVYSLENKTNPRMVDFSRLTLEQRTKERLFFECVNSFK
tara:strand:- start:162 stop:497 length:336 start_codon:yes stop_codon:yes gene_type:complete